jgi:hypothetical protein
MKKCAYIASLVLAMASLPTKAEQTFTHTFTAYTGHQVMLTDKPCTMDGQKYPGLFSAVVQYPTKEKPSTRPMTEPMTSHDKPMTSHDKPMTEHFVLGCWRYERRKNLMHIILFNGDRLILEGKFVGVTA